MLTLLCVCLQLFANTLAIKTLKGHNMLMLWFLACSKMDPCSFNNYIQKTIRVRMYDDIQYIKAVLGM